METDLETGITLDPITGIPTKDAFYQCARKLLDDNPDVDYDFITSDIKHFRVINDLYGYEKGDELICYSAQKVQEACESIGGICGRYFADIIMTIVPRRNGLIDHIVQLTADNLENGPIKPAPKVKFGVYHIDDRSLPISAMYDRSMMALSSLQGHESINYAFFEEKHREKIIKEHMVLDNIDDALANGEVMIYMQPKYNLKTRRISGAETLVRWISPTQGFIPPADFIPILEKSGTILKVDLFVWEETCKTIRRWMDSGIQIVPISVNVSRVDMDVPELEAIFMDMINKYAIPADYFILEITETVYADLNALNISFIENLRRRGFRVEMDDFGSGYSSLNMLKEYFVDDLKVDLDFLSGIGENTRGEKILRLVVDLAVDLDLGVVAEGVEESHQADFLEEIGCETAQGYYFARPMPVEDFERLLAEDQEMVAVEID